MVVYGSLQDDDPLHAYELKDGATFTRAGILRRRERTRPVRGDGRPVRAHFGTP